MCSKHLSNGIGLLCLFIDSTQRLFIAFNTVATTAGCMQGPLVCLDCHHPLMMSLQGSCLWLVLVSFLSTSYVERAQAVVFLATQAAIRECYGQWSSFVVSSDSVTCIIIDAIHHSICCLQNCKSQQNHFPPCSLLLAPCNC